MTEFTFFEDGVCSTPNPVMGPDTELTWFFTEDPDFVIIHQLIGENQYFVRECEIFENKEDQQLWVYETEGFDGFVDFWRNTWTMKKRI